MAVNQGLGIKQQSQSPGNSKYLPAILRLLTLSQSDLNLASDLSLAFEVYPFQLGDQLTNYRPPDGSEHQQSDCDFYLVCQGRVRLLCLDAERQREVSASVLEEGEAFGADYLFCNTSLPYQAIAASPGQVAQISVAKLQPWLEQLPNLQDHLIQQTQQRECLIFCKTSTSLRSLPSAELQPFIPYLVKAQIAAGESLAQVTPSNSGRFWLRSGQIQSGQRESQPPAIGESWGYPDLTTTDWTAQTDLLVYRLPIEHWDNAQELGLGLAPENGAANATTYDIDPGPVTSTVAARDSPPAHPAGNRRPQSRMTLPQSKARPRQSDNPVAFPKPAGRLRQLFRRGHPFIQQQSAADCGAACLAMVGRYWGKRFSLNSLRNLAGVGRAGASLKGLASAAESLGFQARPVRASLSRLRDQTNPWIAHWQGDHYVVVYRVKGDRVLVSDPAVGRRSPAFV